MDQLNINQIPLKEGTIEFFDIVEISATMPKKPRFI